MNEFVQYRREFHKYPENGWSEIRTSARIAEILTGMGYRCLMGPDAVNIDSVGKLDVYKRQVQGWAEGHHIP